MNYSRMIGCITLTKKEKFMCNIGTEIESEGDNDQFLDIIATKGPFDTIEEAIGDMEEVRSSLTVPLIIYKKPFKKNSMGIWMNWLKMHEEGKFN